MAARCILALAAEGKLDLENIRTSGGQWFLPAHVGTPKEHNALLFYWRRGLEGHNTESRNTWVPAVNGQGQVSPLSPGHRLWTEQVGHNQKEETGASLDP